MAIYDTGTASLAANGSVTGVGTTWKAPLTLIRVGATIVFKTEPVKIYTISEIISDTQINVYNPNSETVPAGTGYAILAHDGITVQGLAQDVAETLRYYQSKETSIESLLQFIGQDTFDWPRFEQLATQSTTGAAEALASQIAAAESASTAVDARNTTTAARDETIKAINSAGDAGTLVTLAGYGLATDVTPLISNFDWQNFTFKSGGIYRVNVSSMTNAPADIISTFGTSIASLCIQVISKSGDGFTHSLRVVGQSATNNQYSREIYIQFSGFPGSRVYWPGREFLMVAAGVTGGGATASRSRAMLDVYSKSQVFDGAFRVRGLRSYYGAVGDGVADDTNKLKTAIDELAAGYYDKLVIDTGVFLISGGIIAEFGALNTSLKTIESIGRIKHTSTSGNCMEIRNAFYCDFSFNFIGDGYDEVTIPNYRTADPAGAKQGLVIAGCRACKLKIKATGYEGRVLRTKMNGSVKPSFLDLDITTGNDTSGQAFYLQGTDAWGVIRHAQTNWEYYGSVVDTLTDMTIIYWEAGVKNTIGGPAMELKTLTNCHIGTLAAGGNEVLINGGTGVTIQKGLFGESLTTGSGNGYALRVVGNGFTDGNAKHQLTINNLVTGNATTAGIYLDAVTGVTLNDVLIDGSNYGIVLTNLCRNVSITGELRNQLISGVHATETANLDSVNFEKVHIYNAGSGTHGFDLSLASGTAAVSIRDCRINVKGRYFRLKDSNAGVSVYGGRLQNSDLGLSAERPRHISNVTGVTTRSITTQTIASGSASGTTLSFAHGLVYTPTEIYVTVTDLSNNVSSGSNTILVRSFDATNIVFKYSGSSSLSSPLSFRVTARCEDR